MTPTRQVRIISSTATLLSFMSVSKAVALALPELCIAAYFVAGVARVSVGSLAAWFILAACLIGALARAVDIEGWAYFIPGGLIGRAERVLSPRLANVTAAAVLTERMLLVALACVLCGQYVVSFGAVWIAEWSVTARLTLQEVVTVGAIVLIGLLWARSRIGLDLPPAAITKVVWSAVGMLAVIILLGFGTLLSRGVAAGGSLVPVEPFAYDKPLLAVGQIFWWLVGFALVLPVIGGGDTLAHAAHEFPPPRLHALRRTSRFATFFVFVITVLSSLLFAVLVPRDQLFVWVITPLSGLVQNLAVPAWVSGILTIALVLATIMMLIPAAHVALDDTAQLLRRVFGKRDGGDVGGAMNIAAAAAVLVTIASGAQAAWLGRAYALSIAVIFIIKILVLARLRRTRPEPPAYTVPLNLPWGGMRIPVLLVAAAFIVGLSAVALLLSIDVPALASLSLILILSVSMTARQGRAERPPADEGTPFELMASADVSLGQIDVRPGNVLVAVRHPHSLSHVVAAIQAAGDRDVVVVSVRLLGVDVDYESAGDAAWTQDERQLFTQVATLAERFGRPVRLLIVPAANPFEGVIAVAVRLASSEVYVGESTTLAADEQARLLGEAWERADKPNSQRLRLVIHRRSGRTDSYHLGAHPPALTPNDVDLIHRVWLDAVKTVGPHVHHHDVVRAALTQMEQQLSSSQREDALAVIRNVARPADELAAAVQERNYSRLRELVRNRHANDLAEILTDLSIEDQVVVFRILPRKNAAAVFEYLSLESQETLLKAMAKEDVAALLNNMAPDDRTMFLEELPASVTRQLLSLLTPAQRSVALTLLGYPEHSVGRLMTPHYVSVYEHWTVREVLDFIRTHGHDSETLNVIYVVDDQGMLVDDVRIREFLLTSLDSRVSDLMDRRFVALKATDDQGAAVTAFRQYDRSALPVTDTAGVLIGIVTIDDVLDVAEAAATKDIQQIGGVEALEEPYMRISFNKMVRKRAVWLTVLFFGEMLTATAMGVFENEIAKAVTLALFIPLIISSGGNSGSQATSLVVRALALGEVTLADWWRVMRREVFAGLALGGILGLIGFLRISIFSAFSTMYGPHWLLIAITVGFALVGVVLWGSLIGSLLPFVLQRLGFDPATSSAPFVATLVDVTGLIIYFTVAMVILRGTLL
jgi:magnesium transporter